MQKKRTLRPKKPRGFLLDCGFVNSSDDGGAFEAANAFGEYVWVAAASIA